MSLRLVLLYWSSDPNPGSRALCHSSLFKEPLKYIDNTGNNVDYSSTSKHLFIIAYNFIKFLTATANSFLGSLVLYGFFLFFF